MNFDIVGIMGFVAGLLTTVAFLPQVIKVYKTKSAKDISLPMYVIFTIGIAMWIIYGFMLNSMDILIFNVITFILAITILVYKIRLK
jgi:MtN3 and saliva related transmembrane protein